MAAAALQVHDRAFPEAGMHHPLARTEGRVGSGLRPVEKIAGYRAAQAHLVDELRRNFTQEARWLRVKLCSVHAPVPGVTQGQLPARAGNAHIAKAPFFFQLRKIVGAALMGKKPLLHADQVNPVEFQPLGGMQGHQVDRVGERIGLGLAGLQCGVGQERGQGLHITMDVLVHRKLPGGADQFLQVLNPRKPALALFLAVVLDKSARLDHVVHSLLKTPAGDRFRHVFNKAEKPLERRHGPGRQQLVCYQRTGCAPQRDVIPPGDSA